MRIKNPALVLVAFLVLSLAAVSVSADEEQFTTIDVQTPWMGGPAGDAYLQEAVLGGNVKVLLGSGSSGRGVRIISHENLFREVYILRLVAQEPLSANGVVPQARWPYVGVSFTEMKVDFITADAVQAALIMTDRFQVPQRNGRTEIQVQASTSIDERQPPREIRKYTFKVTLRGVKGLRPDGSLVNLGNFIVFFQDQVIFMHDPSQVQKPVIPGGGCCGGGVILPPGEIDATGPFVDAGSGFTNVIRTLQEYLAGNYFGGGQEDIIIIGPEEPIVITPENPAAPK